MRFTGLFQCMKFVVREGGLFSLYRGLPVQLIGIIPEKALKLSVNDLGRRYLRNSDGSIDLHNEAISGGVAGFAQVIITSPMELLKIRMQEQSKIADPKYSLLKLLSFISSNPTSQVAIKFHHDRRQRLERRCWCSLSRGGGNHIARCTVYHHLFPVLLKLEKIFCLL